jgi:glycine/D-amino acid oxidase-like deaminating enzyme
VIERPYWWDTIPDLHPPDPVRIAAGSTYDVIVVGAGYTGLAAGRQLARAGAKVAVLERERIGSGASSRNGGQVLTGLKLDPATLVARYGEARARELFSVSIDAVDALAALVTQAEIDCDFRRTGHIQAASRPSHFEAFKVEQQLLQRLFGHHVTLVPRADQRSEIASDLYHGLLIDERSGAINPARYLAGLATAAVRAGAKVAENTPATALSRSATNWRVRVPAGEIGARDVLVATDAYTGPLTPDLQRRLIPVGSYIIATEPLAADLARSLLPRGRMAFDSKHFLHYFRLTPDNRILFGGRAEFSQPTENSGRRAAAILQRDLVKVFPELAGTRVEYAWSGAVAFTRDQMPRAGRLNGLWFAGGYAGHGIALATHLGSLVARRIAGEPIEHPLFDDRWAPIPLYRGRPWFLPLAGAYYTLLDLIA